MDILAVAFDLWLEADHVEEEINDFCNVVVTLTTGERYALNVWNFAFFEVARHQGETVGSPAIDRTYLLPPDLFVADLSRATLTAVIEELLRKGLMPNACLIVG